MRHLCRTVGALLAVLTVSVGFGGAALADGSQTMVTKTFTLTIDGTPPATDGFVLGYVEKGKDPNTAGAFYILCADTSKLPPEDVQQSQVISNKPCVGNGNSYSVQAQFPQGAQIAYFFARGNVNDPNGNFQYFESSVQDTSKLNQENPAFGPEDYETINGDMTNHAEFDYNGMVGMPNTGGGGLAPHGSPLVPEAEIAALAGLLLAGGYALRRRGA